MSERLTDHELRGMLENCEGDAFLKWQYLVHELIERREGDKHMLERVAVIEARLNYRHGGS